MSNLSALAKGFEQSAIERSKATDAAVTSALQQHESALRQALSESAQRTSADILASHQRLRRTALGSWTAVAIPVIATLGIGAGMLWWQTGVIADQRVEITRQGETLAKLSAQGGKVSLTECEPDRLCAAIEPKAQTYQAEGRVFRILEGY